MEESSRGTDSSRYPTPDLWRSRRERFDGVVGR
jgi:hypothetical protein